MLYRNFDTGEIWTEEEIREAYECESDLQENYETFEEYLEYLLHLGKQAIGGIVEADESEAE